MSTKSWKTKAWESQELLHATKKYNNTEPENVQAALTRHLPTDLALGVYVENTPEKSCNDHNNEQEHGTREQSEVPKCCASTPNTFFAYKLVSVLKSLFINIFSPIHVSDWGRPNHVEDIAQCKQIAKLRNWQTQKRKHQHQNSWANRKPFLPIINTRGSKTRKGIGDESVRKTTKKEVPLQTKIARALPNSRCNQSLAGNTERAITQTATTVIAGRNRKAEINEEGAIKVQQSTLFSPRPHGTETNYRARKWPVQNSLNMHLSKERSGGVFFFCWSAFQLIASSNLLCKGSHGIVKLMMKPNSWPDSLSFDVKQILRALDLIRGRAKAGKGIASWLQVCFWKHLLAIFLLGILQTRTDNRKKIDSSIRKSNSSDKKIDGSNKNMPPTHIRAHAAPRGNPIMKLPRAKNKNIHNHIIDNCCCTV